jgi:chitinase
VIREKGVYLLHAVDERGWVAGSTYALPSQRLYQALNDVVLFIKSNPREIVTILLEDYTNTNQLKDELEKVKGLKELIYDPDNDEKWRVKDKKEWPLLSDMIERNKRLVIFSQKNHKNELEKIGVAYQQDYIKANYWSIGGLGTNLDCPSMWDDGKYIDADYPKLFVFNHFRDVPSVITAAIDNDYKEIIDRIDNRCAPLVKQLPNFVAVDYFELPAGKRENKPQGVVDELNMRWQNSSQI